MRIPLSTYRLQFWKNFQFKDAQRIVKYLSELGISDIYASPIFKAHKASTHGYDVVDFNQINPEIGGSEGFEEVLKEVKEFGLGWLQDMVPNHMAYDSRNQMLTDIFENGQSSAFFDYFDIEWDYPYGEMRGRILAPFLGEFYGRCLEKGEIRLKYDEAGLSINYYDWRFPIKMESYVKVLTYNLRELKRALGANHPDYIKFLGILYTLKNLPASKEEYKERREQIQFVKLELWEFYQHNEEIRRYIEKTIKVFNGEEGRHESFDLLHDLLSGQLFRLSFWKVATDEVNYRRFFTINSLICLRMQHEEVFRTVHFLLLRLLRDGKITGLRIDHIDGLYEPIRYLRDLREKFSEVYLVVEKILDMNEDLPTSWPVQGTTGYDYLAYLNELFCDRKNEGRFNAIYSHFLGHKMPYKDLVRNKKEILIERHMTGDLDRLARLMKKIASRDRYGSDFTLTSLKEAISNCLMLFPVYRTYISDELFSQADRRYITETIEKAKRLNPDLIYEFEFIEKFFLPEFWDLLNEEEKRDWIDFVNRFQQLTAPLMAKGFEDTVFYVYNRLISLNEVGGNPNIFGISIEDFHEFNKKRFELWPYSINATATHDSKRGEDARARINVLSEIPGQWEENLKSWGDLNQGWKGRGEEGEIPETNDEYLLYQALVGSFPFEDSEYETFAERIKEYMLKAVKEAKVHTGWLKPVTEYEELLTSFVDKILKKTEENQFLKEFIPFQRKVAHYGLFNSLSQVLFKITSPGLPDFYQGTELWDFSLVDPDNRRPVDFSKRHSFLEEIKKEERENLSELIRSLLETREDGRIKLFLVYRLLKARAERKDLFENGDYIPLIVEGKHKDQVVAFLRKKKNLFAVTVAPRLLTSLITDKELPLGREVWQDTCIIIPEEIRAWRDVLTERTIVHQERLSVGEIFKDFPVSLFFNHLI